MAYEREKLRRQLSPDVTESPSFTAREVTDAVIRVNKLKQMIQPLMSHLKSITTYLQGVPNLADDPAYQDLLEKIQSVTLDLDATIHEATGAADDLEMMDRSISVNPMFNPPSTPHERANEDALRNEVVSLRNQLKVVLSSKDAEIEDLKRRIQEVVDEKITLQNQLRNLNDSYQRAHDTMEEGNEHAKEIETLSAHLLDARNSLKKKSHELKDALEQIDQLTADKQELIQAVRLFFIIRFYMY